MSFLWQALRVATLSLGFGKIEGLGLPCAASVWQMYEGEGEDKGKGEKFNHSSRLVQVNRSGFIAAIRFILSASLALSQRQDMDAFIVGDPPACHAASNPLFNLYG